jgi:hypothetical protein
VAGATANPDVVGAFAAERSADRSVDIPALRRDLASALA